MYNDVYRPNVSDYVQVARHQCSTRWHRSDWIGTRHRDSARVTGARPVSLAFWTLVNTHTFVWRSKRLVSWLAVGL